METKVAFIPNLGLLAELRNNLGKTIVDIKRTTGASKVEFHSVKESCGCHDFCQTGLCKTDHVVLTNPRRTPSSLKKEFAIRQRVVSPVWKWHSQSTNDGHSSKTQATENEVIRPNEMSFCNLHYRATTYKDCKACCMGRRPAPKYDKCPECGLMHIESECSLRIECPCLKAHSTITKKGANNGKITSTIP